MADPSRVVVFAPNWLGDAVMALPAITDIRGRFPSATLVVAARSPVADLFALAPSIDRIVTLAWKGRWLDGSAWAADRERLRALECELAVLLPNSFASAWLTRQAGVPERWGYRTDWRGRLLTRGVTRPFCSLHQGAYYQRLTRELGFDSGPLEPALTVPEQAEARARAFLVERGWDAATPLVVFAPGAAYGTAKRWLPDRVANVASDVARAHGATCVLVGSAADAATARQVRAATPADVMRNLIDATGQTTIETLAGVLRLATACVSNDSGAMHMAAAIGTPLVALFGPTNEHETRPLTRNGRVASVLTHTVWCRPCMLRECPIDHRCMKGITTGRVLDALAPLVDRC